MTNKKEPPDKKVLKVTEVATSKIIKVTENVTTSRITQFSNESITSILQNAVLRTHASVTNSLFLSKLMVIQEYEKISSNGFNHTVASNFTNWLISTGPFKDNYFKHLLSVVSSETILKRTGRKFKDQDVIKFYDDQYTLFSNQDLLPKTRVDGLNLSTIFGYTASNLKVAYVNNIQLNFDKYVKRYIRMVISTRVFEEHNVDSKWDLSKDLRSELNTLLNKSIKYVLYNGAPPLQFIKEFIDDNILQVIPLFTENDKPLCYNVKIYPERFLPYMIYMNRELEGSAKLLNPLPMRLDFIPKNITIDTTSLIDLIIVKEMFTVESLKALVSLKTGWDLSLFKTKGDFLKDITKLIKNAPRDLTSEEFKTIVWKVVTNIDDASLSKRLAKIEVKGQVFNNIITTDGYKVDLHVVNKEAYFSKRFTKGEKMKRETPSKKEEFTYVQKIEDGLKQDILGEKYVKLYCDPGKGNIITISDGIKGHSVLKYSSVQRRFESSTKRNIKELEKLKSVYKVNDNENIQDIIQSMTNVSANSCHIPSFGEYLKCRKLHQSTLETFFMKDSHRRRRYRARLGRQSSEDKLFNKMNDLFGARIPVIFWGNWGRNPNLANQAPSPGIGLRRRFHKKYLTLTLDERYTSSRCPNCASEVFHPVKRNVEHNGKIKERDVHHLLCCKNNNCESKWWHRDILAICNFVKQTQSYLETGHPHPDLCLLNESS